MSSSDRFLSEWQRTLDRTLAGHQSFHIFAAVEFTSHLPFRKRYYLAGSDVVERQAVEPIVEATFILGCSLSLSLPSAAEFALNDFLEPFFTWSQVSEDPTLTSEFGSIVLIIRRSDSAIFDEVLRPLITSLDDLLEPDRAIGVLQEAVLRGLVYGLLRPKLASGMLSGMLQLWQHDWAVGLREQPPAITSVEEALSTAGDLFRAWPGSQSFLATGQTGAAHSPTTARYLLPEEGYGQVDGEPQTYKVGLHPWRFAVGAGSLWVMHGEGAEHSGVYRIELPGGKLTQIVAEDTDVYDVKFGEGFLWAVDYDEARVLRVDPSSGQISRIRSGSQAYTGTHANIIQVHHGSLWVLGERGLNQHETTRGKRVRVWRLTRLPLALCPAGDYMVALHTNERGERDYLTRIEQSTGDIVTHPTPRGIIHNNYRESALASDGRHVWLSDSDGALNKVGLEDGSLTARRDLEQPLHSLVFAAGKLWAAVGEQAVTIDLDTLDFVETYDLPGAVHRLVNDGRRIWALLRDQGLVTLVTDSA